MLNGYCLMVRDYKAEIVEFATLSIITMPDESKLYFVRTKFGDDYMHESELSPTKDRFEADCEALNKTLEKAKKGAEFGIERSIYHQRPHR